MGLDRYEGDMARVRDELFQALNEDRANALTLHHRHVTAVEMAHAILPRAAELQIRVNRAFERVPELEAMFGDLMPKLGMAVTETLYEYVTGRQCPPLRPGMQWEV